MAGITGPQAESRTQARRMTFGKLIGQARGLMRQEQRRCGDGLPDGYRVLDDRGKEVHAERLGLN